MTVKLFFEAIVKFVLGVILVAALLFLPAGTFHFFNGWIFMAVLFIPMFFAGIVMLFKNPVLLKSRLDSKEKQKNQDMVVKLSGLMFVLGFIVAGLDFRFGWSKLPFWVTIAAVIIFIIAYIIYAEVLKENAYLSRTIKVEQNQQVVETGLYSIVRHPMYSATLFLFLSMPLILGSFYSFIIFLLYPFFIVKRLKMEEELLKTELKGYKQYMEKTKYRLIPFIW